ncbi:MAG: hypothetical protein Q7R34_15665 [Dehalococcoidia bacterium]|nr:hypothetical protein [Dehalococcoidia bacterium]
MSPAVAEALHVVSFDCIHVLKQFPDYPDGSADDAVILEYCVRTRTIWITSDEKRERLIKRFPSQAQKVTLLLVKGPKNFPAWLQLKIIVRVLDELERKAIAAHGAIHFKATQSGGPSPTIIWTEHPQDRPKNFK